MKGKFLLILGTAISGISITTVTLAPVPALSQINSECQQQEEVFTFQLSNYLTNHQGRAVLNINISYRLTPEVSAQNKYPNFLPIRKDVDDFLVNYPRQSDYWEIVNKNLVKFILGKYPQMSSLQIDLDVMPTEQEPWHRSSIVKSTRPGRCPLSL